MTANHLKLGNMDFLDYYDDDYLFIYFSLLLLLLTMWARIANKRFVFLCLAPIKTQTCADSPVEAADRLKPTVHWRHCEWQDTSPCPITRRHSTPTPLPALKTFRKTS